MESRHQEVTPKNTCRVSESWNRLGWEGFLPPDVGRDFFTQPRVLSGLELAKMSQRIPISLQDTELSVTLNGPRGLVASGMPSHRVLVLHRKEKESM